MSSKKQGMKVRKGEALTAPKLANDWFQGNSKYPSNYTNPKKKRKKHK